MNTIYILPIKTDAYGFVKQLAAKKYNTDVSALKINKGAHGKPYFENLPDFHFNVSHSGEVKVLAVSDHNVGIDVEKMRPLNLRVAKRFCNYEYAYIAETGSAVRFTEVWTKKEAFLKYSGDGLTGGLNTFSVFKTDIPVKTFIIGDYTISVCGKSEFKINDLR